MHVCKYASMQVCKYASLQVCSMQYVSMQVIMHVSKYAHMVKYDEDAYLPKQMSLFRSDSERY